MAKIIAVANQKGGVGKTTTSTALAAGLTDRGYKTLLIDTDPQFNATDTFAADVDDHPTIYDVFEKEATMAEAIQHTEQGDIVPGYLRMSGADVRYNASGREYILKEAVSTIADRYDYIIIDTPPALGIITINAMTAADRLLIPTIADRYSMQGISQIWETIESVKKYTNVDLQVDGILLTKHNNRLVMQKSFADSINRFAISEGVKVYKTSIRTAVAMQESQTTQSSIFAYAPESTTAKDYNDFIDEFLEREKSDG